MTIRSLLLPLLPLLGLVGAALSGCADEADEQPADDVAQDELRSSGITQLTVGRSLGLQPPPAGKCVVAARWTVDFAAKTVDTAACIDNRPNTVHRVLAPQEITLIRAAVAGVRVAPSPESCPTDAPVASLQIVRGDKKFSYVEQRSACGGTRAVTGASIGALLDVMRALPN